MNAVTNSLLSAALFTSVLSLNSSALACDGEGKHDKGEKSPSMLCDGEGKHDKGEKSPSLF